MLPESELQSLFRSFSYRTDYVEDVSDAFSEVDLGLPASSPAGCFRYRYVKRTIDVIGVLAVAPIALVICACISLVLLVTSKGPVLFKHSRLKCGSSFDMWKFRTMCRDSHRVLQQHLELDPAARVEWEACHKLRRDPRINAFGAFLRRTSLDELPQLWNVLRGDMSLVGPRPIVDEEIAKYGPDYWYYAAVKPGITGLWQISGRSSLSYCERVSLDRFYVENWSLGLEVKIMAGTLKSVANSDGAY